MNFIEKCEFNKDNIERIIKVIENTPTSFDHIADAIEEAIPLFDYLGPDGLLIATIKEKQRRHIE